MKSIPEIVALQKSFFQKQNTLDISYRLSLLKALRQEILSKEQDILDALHKDFKKSEFESYISEFGLVISELNLVIKKLKTWATPKRVFPALITLPSKDYIYKSPYGTVLVIAPWNYPFLLAIEPLIMAIAAGNTVVLKPSELTENTAKTITEIINKVFPKEVATSVEGGVETATELLAQNWDYIFFTGSTKVGKIVAKAAAKHLTPVTLELGGKSPCIIDDTNNLKLVVRRLVWAKLFNGGQTCIAPDYVIVKSAIKDELIEGLKKEIIRRYGKNPKTSEDLPRIINAENLKRLKQLIENEVILFGGEFDENDNYFAPTLIDNPGLDSAVMQEEIFGPILPILTYDTEEDIERIILNGAKPLSFYIFSKDNNFIERTVKKYRFGGGVINDLMVHFGNPKLPFGGIGNSGMGKYHGKHGFNTFSHDKSIMKRGTWLDPSFRYAPYKGKMNLLRKVFKYLG
ncbi:aldehyde dehydrogenase (NAD+) [Hyunsoonleella jejuensis]|uniref:Aldehyde dehydrogenase n=1 Tax=Hyunsoonleella jejuensis TaxID=419940 RepID=A0A1H9KBF6_9FLAO|nr:aldehyde dehydrogenase [Hyunsoonleella jejuensis]SEQ96439.1 aldehyde dehydrogenase (NAD+) [Hyunsoonleella jejuensis]